MSFLTDDERSRLRAQHKQERDRRICDRIKAVLLHDKDWSYKEIADALLLSEDAIRHHIRDYQVSSKLKPEGGGSTEKLSKEQSEQLEAHLQEHIYLYVKDITSWIKSKWGIHYSQSGLICWLDRHGFSYKKPAIVPGKADEEQQQKWLVAYEELKANLLPTETICFTDGVHPTHNIQPAYGWMKKGERVAIASNSGRSRLNITGTIDIKSHKVLIQEDKTLNAESTINFFQKVEAAYPEMTKVHVFCDNASYYRNKLVTKYLEDSKIKLHFLPPYSPNLNPIERLWKWMKECVVYNTYYQEFDDFRDAIFGFFSTLAGADPGSVIGQQFRSRVGDRFRPVNSPIK